MSRIVYLGPEGSYTQLAAQKFAQKDDTLVPMPDFSKTIHSVSADTCAVVPIENSLEGTVNQVMDILIWEVNLFIAKEINLSINHKIFVKKGTQKEDIKRIVTHPQAYGQCRSYLAEKFPDIKIEFSESTAKALEYLDNNTAAIAGGHNKSDTFYVLDEMSVINNNKTKFILLKKTENISPLNNKISIIFETENKPGGLWKILQILSDYNLNMTKIESRPHKSTMGRYLFITDFLGNINDEKVSRALSEIKLKCGYYKYIGNYISE